MNNFLTVHDIAIDLNVMPLTVRQWIKAGKLKASKFNNAFIIAINDYEQFKKDREARAKWQTSQSYLFLKIEPKRQ